MLYLKLTSYFSNSLDKEEYNNFMTIVNLLKLKVYDWDTFQLIYFGFNASKKLAEKLGNNEVYNTGTHYCEN